MSEAVRPGGGGDDLNKSPRFGMVDAGETAVAGPVMRRTRKMWIGWIWRQQQVVRLTMNEEMNSTMANVPMGTQCVERASSGQSRVRAACPACTLKRLAVYAPHALASRVSVHMLAASNTLTSTMETNEYPLEVHAWVCQHITFVDVKPDADLGTLKV
jgi:hypothetical protein